MDFARLERAWNGPANTPSAAASAYVVDEMIHTLKTRRAEMARVYFAGLVLIVWTAAITYRAVVRPFPFDIGREWGVLPLAALPWIGLAFLWRERRRHLLAHPDPYRSVAATLCALLDENRTAQRGCRFAWRLAPVATAGLALALAQLMQVGKMSPQNVMQASLGVAIIMTVVGGWAAWRQFRVLKPEQARLERLLAQYTADG